MLVHKDTTANTYVPTTVPRTSASAAQGSHWTQTRALVHVSKLLSIQTSYCFIQPYGYESERTWAAKWAAK